MVITTASGKTMTVHRARDLSALTGNRIDAGWTPATFTGRLCEFVARSGTPWLTLLCRLILNAQRGEEPVAWITLTEDTFYPPDFSANGVNLSRLTTIFAPDLRRASRSAEHLLRSGAFGLVILQLDANSLPDAALGRLGSLCEQYNAALLLVTSSTRADASRRTLGSLISLRLESRIRAARATEVTEGRFVCELLVTKDKLNGPGRTYTEVCSGLPGLR